jgi:hypothetical protein
MFEVHPSTIAAGDSAEVRFNVRQARRIRISPADGDVTDWNRRFTASERIQDFEQSARVRPLQTTTYTITADVVADPALPSFRTVSANVTLNVINPQGANASGRDPCSSGRYNFDAIDVPDGSVRIMIAKKCADNVEQWSMTLTYAPVKGRPVTASFDADGADEGEAMKGLSQARSLSKSFVNAIERELYPVLKSDDSSQISQSKMVDAIKRALRSVK